jgi:3-phenylpropionate/cinnamic acid dioxygenase small subunit
LSQGFDQGFDQVTLGRESHDFNACFSRKIGYNNKQATSNKQQATSNKQQATSIIFLNSSKLFVSLI